MSIMLRMPIEPHFGDVGTIRAIGEKFARVIEIVNRSEPDGRLIEQPKPDRQDDRCAACGLKRRDHNYSGGAYGVCGKFIEPTHDAAEGAEVEVPHEDCLNCRCPPDKRCAGYRTIAPPKPAADGMRSTTDTEGFPIIIGLDARAAPDAMRDGNPNRRCAHGKRFTESCPDCGYVHPRDRAAPAPPTDGMGETEQEFEDRLHKEDARDMLRLIDHIADKIGIPHDEELSRDNFRRWFNSLQPSATGAAEPAATPQQVQEACAQVADRAAQQDEEFAAKYPDEAHKFDQRAHRAKTIATSIRALIPPVATPPVRGARETDDELAEQIYRVAGCHVKSARTQKLIAWYRAKSLPVQPGADDLSDIADWCNVERSKIGAVDGYDYRSGEEFGLRRVEIEINKRQTLSAFAPADGKAAT